MMRLPLPPNLVRGVLRIAFKTPSRLPVPLPWLRTLLDLGAQTFPVRPDVVVETLTLGGVPVERLTPRQVDRRVLLHFHGGAFFAGSARSHRALGCEVAARAKAVVITVDYRRAPEHPYPAALDDGLACYRALRESGVAAADIVLSGDSGGCAILLALALTLRDQGQALPGALIMMSPYLDLTLSLPAVRRHAVIDPMTAEGILRRGAEAWRGSIPASDPRVSPLNADLRGLPPTLVQAGEDEILADDALEFAVRARRVGVSVTCRLYPGMWHNFQMFHAHIDTAVEALDEIAGFLRN